MDSVVCISESIYHDALTRGKQYEVLEVDSEKHQIRIRGDNEQCRWFPMNCFDFGNRPVSIMTGLTIDDPIKPGDESLVEVTVSFSTGERRWCLFGTPAALSNGGSFIEDTRIRFHYANRHLIIADVLTEALIERILHYIDSQNELIECSLPLDLDAEDRSEANE